MKNSKLVKVVISMILSIALVVMANQVLAANDFTDLTNTLSGNNTSNSATNNTSSGNNTATNNTTTKNNTTNNTAKNNTTVLTTNNTSSYNNTSLPKTGVEDSIPGVILVVVLGISAIYAYRKIQYYKDI